MTKITILPGDGIGPEITSSVVEILDALDLGLQYDWQIMGIQALDQYQTLIPSTTCHSYWRRLPLSQCPTATTLRSLCQYPTSKQYTRCQDPL